MIDLSARAVVTPVARAVLQGWGSRVQALSFWVESLGLATPRRLIPENFTSCVHYTKIQYWNESIGPCG